ncbi:Homeobox-leucine zipper protein hox32 [Asimina triloba]
MYYAPETTKTGPVVSHGRAEIERAGGASCSAGLSSAAGHRSGMRQGFREMGVEGCIAWFFSSGAKAEEAGIVLKNRFFSSGCDVGERRLSWRREPAGEVERETVASFRAISSGGFGLWVFAFDLLLSVDLCVRFVEAFGRRRAVGVEDFRVAEMALTIHKDSAKMIDAGKYVRYTPEQVEALERVYAECPKPSSLRRQQLIRDCPILSNIEPKQIKVWFQNRRCREKQRKEASRLQTVNRKLTAMNKLLMEENDRLQKQVSQLVYENGYMKQQLHTASVATTDTSCESVVTSGQHQQNPTQHSQRDANNPAGLLAIAEETLAEFLSKATGTAVDWVQMLGMKPGPDSIGIVAVSHNCSGVAARACGLVNLEPTKVAEILKDRLSWYRDCRCLEVVSVLPAGNGGTIELIYMQTYAPTTLASARDFWTLRYTTGLEDGSLVVCERSLTQATGGPSGPPAQNFVRAEMLPSGYLIRPCEGGGSIIHIVDHVDLDAWSVPEVLRPLYESSKIVAQKMTIAALRHIRQIAQETSGEIVYGGGRQPAVLRTFSQRLSRGFNDAVNGFADDGWSLMSSDGVEDVTIAVNSSPSKLLGSPMLPTLGGGVLCAKASMLLQNVPPALLVQFLREHRSEWADPGIDAYSAASLKASPFAVPGARSGGFPGSQAILPLAQTVEHEETSFDAVRMLNPKFVPNPERDPCPPFRSSQVANLAVFWQMLEVVRLEGHGFAHEDAVLPRDMYLLQLCSGIDENAVGACAQLVFAPIDESFADDAPLVPSGFRVIPLDPKNKDSIVLKITQLEVHVSFHFSILRAVEKLVLHFSVSEDGPAATRTLDLASALEGPGAVRPTGETALRSVLTIAFQFTFESHLRDSVAAMARQYVRSVVGSVQRVAMAITPSRLGSQIGPKHPPGTPEALTLARWICRSYRFHTGLELLRADTQSGDSVLRLLWHHSDAIMCCLLKTNASPIFTFANQAGLDMLETTLVALQDILLDKILDESGRKMLCSEFPKIMQQASEGSQTPDLC